MIFRGEFSWLYSGAEQGGEGSILTIDKNVENVFSITVDEIIDVSKDAAV